MVLVTKNTLDSGRATSSAGGNAANTHTHTHMRIHVHTHTCAYMCIHTRLHVLHTHHTLTDLFMFSRLGGIEVATVVIGVVIVLVIVLVVVLAVVVVGVVEIVLVLVG